MSTVVTYVGDSTVIGGGSGGTWSAINGFVDAHTPLPGKSEWGMDMLVRTMRGTQPQVASFVAGLAQGSTYTFNGTTYYLQTWEPDNGAVFPSVSLHYKGLVGGIPNPKASGQMIEQSISLTCNSPQDASREIRYVTRQTSTLYIASSIPTGPSYGLDVSINIRVIQSVIRTGDGALFYGSAPAALVTALTPSEVTRAFMRCSPVVGSPYYECEDVASLLYQGN